MFIARLGGPWIGRVVRLAKGLADRMRMAAIAAVFAAANAPAAATAGATDAAADPHAHHHMSVAETKRSTASYSVPDIRLVRDDGKAVSLRSELDDGRPVVLAFIYTSCTTVCPVISQVLADLQHRLGPERDQVHVMSISIDPDQDTPARLHEYALRFDAGPEWQHYTGTLAASQAAQRAFDVYRGDKMSHAPAVLVRPMPGAPWIRIDGFATAAELMAELPAALRGGDAR